MLNQSSELAERMDCQTIEGLLLMAVLGQEPLKASALRELRRRRAVEQEEDFTYLYMTNLSVAAC